MASTLSDPIRYAPVTRPYRRWLAWSASLLLHLAIIGLVASRPFAPAPPERTSLDVVLVPRPALQAPGEAEAIAETAQRAAGEAAESPPAETRAAPLNERPVPPAESEPVVATPPIPEAPDRAAPEAVPEPTVAANAERDREASTVPPEESRDSAPVPIEPPASAAASEAPAASEPSATAAPVSGRDLLAQATASIRQQGLTPDFSGEASGGARPAAQQAAEARYIDGWTRRVEDYGNRVHPAPAHLDGQLRIRVVIGRDGQVRRAEVIQSSGHAELDQAALDTVHGAAPYRPFDRGMGDLDSLSITRVWRFGDGNHYGVH